MSISWNSDKPLILASGSPRRRELMQEAGYSFRTVPSPVLEGFPEGMDPQKIVVALALRKAKSISRKNPKAVVVGADTLVWVDGRPLGKPKNFDHAKIMLKILSGRWQQVYTGVAVIWNGGAREKAGYSISHVKLKNLSEEEIKQAAKKHLDKAGAYAVQDKKDPFVEKIKGDYDNVVGLPMTLLDRLLKSAG